MRRIISLAIMTIILSTAAVCANAADDAMQLLDRAAKRLTSAKSVYATYTVNGPGGKMKGDITVAGQKFVASSDALTTWFDGKTQWAYAPSTGEVNIIEPTAEELAQSNPFAIINSLRHNYKAAVVKSAPGTRSIKMTAIDRNADIRQVVITLKASDLSPTAISATLADGARMAITINSLQLKNTVNPAMFTFDKKKYPKARINDMR